MDQTSSWDESQRAAKGGGFGRWVLLAVAVAVILHAVVLYAMGRIPFVLGITEALEWQSRSFNVEQVEMMPEAAVEELVPGVEEAAPPEDAGSLLMEIEELLPQLENFDIDISPNISEPEVALKMEAPALMGEESGELLEPVRAPEVSPDLVEVGSAELLFAEVPDGQVVIEEGAVTAEMPDSDEYLREAVRKGAGGLSEEGVLEGYTSLGGLLSLPTGELNKSRAALPSDLLFEYDSAQLKEGARLGLMKLAILIDRNPTMFCILEGHSDQYGTDEYNMALSRRRAEAVKEWLVESLRLDGEQILVRAYGKTQAKVLEGSVEEQAINRRVDILMRKERPPEAPVLVLPNRAVPVEGEGVTPLRAEPVEPGRAVPVEVDVTPPRRAVPVTE